MKCGLWFHSHRLSESGERLFIHHRFPDYYSTAYDMQGRSVGVNEGSGDIKLRWKKDDGSKAIVCLKVKPAIPGAGANTQSRSVSFTEHGIDIVDAQGNPFRFQVRQDLVAPASVPRNALAGIDLRSGPLALELWKAVRSAHGYQVEEEKEVHEAKDWGLVKGVTAIARNATQEKPKQNRSPHPLDALYPLDEFLKQRFPNGGVFRTAAADRIEGSTEDLQAFAVFLEQPEWCKHPFYDFWHTALTRVPADVALLGKNLMILRSCRQEKTRPYSKLVEHYENSQDRCVRESVYHIGPPKSALKDPFRTEAANQDDDADAAEAPVAGPSQGRPKRAPKKTPASYKNGRHAIGTRPTAAANTGKGEEGEIDAGDEDEETIIDITERRPAGAGSARKGKGKRRAPALSMGEGMQEGDTKRARLGD